jgi:hypothetical protein
MELGGGLNSGWKTAALRPSTQIAATITHAAAVLRQQTSLVSTFDLSTECSLEVSRILGIPEWAISTQGQHASLLSGQRDSPDNFSLYPHSRL